MVQYIVIITEPGDRGGGVRYECIKIAETA